MRFAQQTLFALLLLLPPASPADAAFTLRSLESLAGCFPSSEAVLRPALASASRALAASSAEDAPSAARVASILLAGSAASGLAALPALLVARLGAGLTLDLLDDTALPSAC